MRKKGARIILYALFERRSHIWRSRSHGRVAPISEHGSMLGVLHLKNAKMQMDDRKETSKMENLLRLAVSDTQAAVPSPARVGFRNLDFQPSRRPQTVHVMIAFVSRCFCSLERRKILNIYLFLSPVTGAKAVILSSRCFHLA